MNLVYCRRRCQQVQTRPDSWMSHLNICAVEDGCWTVLFCRAYLQLCKSEESNTRGWSSLPKVVSDRVIPAPWLSGVSCSTDYQLILLVDFVKRVFSSLSNFGDSLYTKAQSGCWQLPVTLSPVNSFWTLQQNQPDAEADTLLPNSLSLSVCLSVSLSLGVTC